MTLLEFAAARRAAGHPTAAVVDRYRLPASPQQQTRRSGVPSDETVDIACPRGTQQQTRRAIDGTNRQTDAVPCLCGVQSLSRLCGSAVDVDTVSSTNQRLDVLEQSIARMSSQAEQHGAVQQVRATSPRQ